MNSAIAFDPAEDAVRGLPRIAASPAPGEDPVLVAAGLDLPNRRPILLPILDFGSRPAERLRRSEAWIGRRHGSIPASGSGRESGVYPVFAASGPGLERRTSKKQGACPPTRIGSREAEFAAFPRRVPGDRPA